MGILLRAVALLAVVFGLVHHARAASVCIGVGSTATDKLCGTKTSKTSCIKTQAFDSQNITASCIWHSVHTKRVKDYQNLKSKSGLPIGVTGLNYRGSLCALSAKVALPKQATSKWGAVVALRGGPVAGGILQGSTNPNIGMSTSSCQASKGLPRVCKAKIAAPKGMNLHPGFVENSLTVDFFTTDRNSVKSWVDEQQLPAGQSYDVRMEYTFTKCGVDKKDEPFDWRLPTTSFHGFLGTVGYNLFENYDRGWFAQDYKMFEVTNSTEVTWSFNVTKTLSSRLPKQSLVTFMMKESDYTKWADKCIVCAAPTEYAMKGSFCQGTQCTVRRRYLGRSGRYFIYVGFADQVSNAYNDRSYSDAYSPAAVKSSNTKQAVSVEVFPKFKFSNAAKREAYEVYGAAEDRKWVDDVHARGIFELA